MALDKFSGTPQGLSGKKIWVLPTQSSQDARWQTDLLWHRLQLETQEEEEEVGEEMMPVSEDAPYCGVAHLLPVRLQRAFNL